MKTTLGVLLFFTFIVGAITIMYKLASPYVDIGERLDLTADGGVFFSQDRGLSWRQASAVEKSEILGRSNISAIVSRSQNPEILWAASGSGLYLSQDYGKTWSRQNLSEDPQGSAVKAIALDPKEAEVMYVAAAKKGDSRGVILKSRNGGKSFYSVFTTPPGAQELIVGLSVNQDAPNKIVAVSAAGSVLASENFGESWQAGGEVGEAVAKIITARKNQDLIYALSPAGNLWRSRDRGKSWRKLSAPRANDLAVDPRDPSAVYLASSRGVFHSSDYGAGFRELPFVVKAGAIAVTAVEVSPHNSDVLFVGAGNQVYKTRDKGESWQVRLVSTARTIGTIFAHPQRKEFIYLGVQQ